MKLKNFAYNIYKIINEAFDFNDNTNDELSDSNIMNHVHDSLYFRDCATALSDYCMQEYAIKLRKPKNIIKTEFGAAYYDIQPSDRSIPLIFLSSRQFNTIFPNSPHYIDLDLTFNEKTNNFHTYYKDDKHKSIILEYVTNLIKLIFPPAIYKLKLTLSIDLSKDNTLLNVFIATESFDTRARILCFNPIYFNNLIKNNFKLENNKQTLDNKQTKDKLIKYFSAHILAPELKLNFSHSISISEKYWNFYTSSDSYTYLPLTSLMEYYSSKNNENKFNYYPLKNKRMVYSLIMLIANTPYTPTKLVANTEILNTVKIHDKEYITSAKYSSIDGNYEIYWAFDLTKGSLIDKDQKLSQSNILDVFNNTGINLSNIKQIADYYMLPEDENCRWDIFPNNNDIIFYGAIKLTDKGQKLFNEKIQK